MNVGRPVSRDEARAAGLSRYFTGKPCGKGHVSERSTSTTLCIACRKAAVVKWRAENPETVKRKGREYWARFRVLVLRHYSGGGMACACCGEGMEEFLTIDHMSDDGNAHRLEIGGKTGVQFYKWLTDRDFPGGYQVLCFNCNCAKSIHGVCPHQGART